MPRKKLKTISPSLTLVTKNPLLAIRFACKNVKNNLDQMLEYLDLIAVVAKRGLSNVDKILEDEVLGAKEGILKGIDKRKFVYILISTAVTCAIEEFAFANDKERALVSVDLEDDFDVKSDEDLTVFVIQILLKNSLYHKSKIDIWLDAKVRCVYFRYSMNKRSDLQIRPA